MTAVDSGSWLAIAWKTGNLGRVEAIRTEGWREKLLGNLGCRDRGIARAKRKSLMGMLFEHVYSVPKLEGVLRHSYSCIQYLNV